ncbi:tetratricopeptide repeat protein [Enterovirga sp. CN4-39]|uniref:tetratricopeptide repeat protein n=1 Tax=Enterovirga sp. CN4-39 TaxID=3400910 RepID=UPI003C0599C9
MIALRHVPAALLAGLLCAGTAGAQETPKAPAAAGRAAKVAPEKPAASARLDLAFGAYQRGLYLTAFREATKRIEADPKDGAAMTLLGELYNQGLGVRQDATEAARWYRLAAERGDAHAMASLGLMTADGRGVKKDPGAARAWFEKAAGLGEATASYNLALLLLAGGAEADLPEVARLLRVAADAELGDAQHDLGVLYARGKGVRQNAEEAAKLYIRSAKNGSIAGEVALAIALFNGDGIEKNEAHAARLFRRTALRGNAIAQNRLARIYATGRGVPRNLIEAAAWHLMASGQGLPDSWLDSTLKDMPEQDRKRAEQLATERAAVL